MDIQNTTDYSQFKILNANREIRQAHVKQLIISISEKNLLAEHPIEVNSEMEILDGQHRLKAAEALGLPIYYYVANDSDLNDVRLLNVNQRPWTWRDYINFYDQQGKSAYTTLKKFMENTHLPVGVALTLLTTENGRREGGDVMLFKNGNIVVLDEVKAYEMAEKIREIEPYTEGAVVLDRDFIVALYQVYTKFKHSQVMNKLRKLPRAFALRSNVRNYLREFEDLMNYGAKKRVSLSDV